MNNRINKIRIVITLSIVIIVFSIRIIRGSKFTITVVISFSISASVTPGMLSDIIAYQMRVPEKPKKWLFLDSLTPDSNPRGK